MSGAPLSETEEADEDLIASREVDGVVYQMFVAEKLDYDEQKRFWLSVSGSAERSWLSKAEALVLMSWAMSPVRSKRWPNGYVPREWWAVELDETASYVIDEEDVPFVDRIMCVYVFDRNTHTHLCEASPSYFLRHLYDYVLMKEDAVEADDVFHEQRDRLEERYCHEGGENTYLHVSVVEEMDSKRKYGPISFEKDVENEEESVCEYLQGNWPF